MNQVERARRFSQLAYSAALGEIVREFDEKRHALRVRVPTRGTIIIWEEARLEGEQITAKIKAQLHTLLDGYELNGVPVDDDMAAAIANEVGRSLDAAIRPPEDSLQQVCSRTEITKYFHMHQVRQRVGISLAWIRQEIDRRRFTKNAKARPFILPHFKDDDAKFTVNSADNSVHAVIRANAQLFSDLRQKIESCLCEGSERTVILEKLAALEQAQSLQSLAQHYTEFILAAANHILLLMPFDPAMAEMMHKASR